MLLKRQSNGDTLTDCDLGRLVDRHLTTEASVTMAVVRGDVGRYGGVLVRPNGFVAGFSNASAATSTSPTGVRSLHFIGVQAVNANVFDGVPENVPSETVRTLYPALIAANARAVAAFESTAEFLDVGTPADYYQTAVTIAAREHVPLDRGEAVVIEPGAQVDKTILWDRVRIGRDARLRNCIVTDDVWVPGSVSYDRSVITVSSSGLAVLPL